MYNKQLDTFFKVAELGSFSKAAEALYITPSAVVQQLNNLESNLGVKLLKRTQRGTSLTVAGEFLLREGQVLVQTSKKIQSQLRFLQEEENQEICVGTSPVEQCRLFYQWWSKFAKEYPHCQVRIKPIQSMGNEMEREEVDLIEGVYVGDMCGETFAFLQLTTVPIVHAVWKGHSLAKKRILRYEDMRGQTLMTLSGDRLMDHIKRLRTEAEQYGIRVVTRAYYDISSFTTCAINGYVMQMPLSNKDANSELVAIPCGWDYTVPYGFYYKKDASPLVRRFIAFMKQQITEQEIKIDWENIEQINTML